MKFVKSLVLAMMVMAASAGVRADDNGQPCKSCEEKKPKCDACEKAKRCGNPIKNFFVHSVGGTIGNGLNQVPCKFEGAYNSTASAVTPKSDCGCNK